MSALVPRLIIRCILEHPCILLFLTWYRIRGISLTDMGQNISCYNTYSLILYIL
jgi:hypothetical protein